MSAVLDLSPDELLTTTRAVRRRLDLDRPVAPALIRECLQIAVQAPSGGNAQIWRWVVVTDPDLRGQIGELYRRAFAAYRDSSRYAGRLFADDADRARVQQRVAGSADYLAEHMGRVPVLIIPCMQVAEGRFGEGSQAGAWGSLHPAVWNYMLAARARGLGTAWTSLHLAYEREVAELLGIPSDVRQGALIPTAHTIGTDFRPAKRAPLDEVVHWDRW